jgi:hypothetical protein
MTTQTSSDMPGRTPADKTYGDPSEDTRDDTSGGRSEAASDETGDETSDETLDGTAGRAAASVRDSEAVGWWARGGLFARGVFYVLLAYIAARIAATGPDHDHQANANGALHIVSGSTFGVVLLAAAAFGFFAFAVTRWAAVARDDSFSLFRRATTAGQGLFYAGIGGFLIEYLVGSHNEGSKQSHVSTTAHIMRIPGGRVILVGIGLVIVGVSLWQIRIAASDDYKDGMDVERMNRFTRPVVEVSGTAGIAARAATFIPVGCFLAAAAVTADPSKALGLDRTLLLLSGHWYGTFAIAAVAAGFVVFAVYSFLEGWYKDIEAAA